MTPDQRFDRRLREIVQATRSPIPEGERLARLLRDFRALHGRPSWARRLAAWFAVPHRLPAPAIALAAVILVVQSVAVVSLLPGGETYRGMSAARCDDAPRIRVVFKPDAPQAEVVMLLRKVEASVTAGPTETGQLWLRIPPDHPVDEALAQIKASAFVDEAILLPPARDCRP